MDERKKIIKDVLNTFFGEELTGHESYADNFIGVYMDAEDIELLSTAIDDALAKVNT